MWSVLTEVSKVGCLDRGGNLGHLQFDGCQAMIYSFAVCVDGKSNPGDQQGPVITPVY